MKYAYLQCYHLVISDQMALKIQNDLPSITHAKIHYEIRILSAICALIKRRLHQLPSSTYFYLGAGLIYFSNVVKEVSYDYTDCNSVVNGQATADTCGDILEKSPSSGKFSRVSKG